jgi:hypothetical protein
MFIRISRVLFCSLFLLAAFFPKSAFSAYIEGVDTTDANGYGLDSGLYMGGNSSVNVALGQKIVNYAFCKCEGYFNYSFDDIKMSPSSVRLFSCYTTINTCFIIQNSKDYTYSKVQILKNISGNRYLFRYGTNTTPLDTTLVKSDYDRSILYKPNNVWESFWYNFPEQAGDTLFWDPPLPNNNHLIGYMLYKTKRGAVIDTTAPINLAQWDSMLIGTQTSYIGFIQWLQIIPAYFNIVAVYTEGKSDFLKGWTCLSAIPVNARNYSTVSLKPQKEIEIRKYPTGYIINFTQRNFFPSFLSIDNITGKQVFRYSGIKSNPIYWNISGDGFSPGLYIIKADLPDHTVLTQPFMFTK